jgi:hypothetical protein
LYYSIHRRGDTIFVRVAGQFEAARALGLRVTMKF